MLGDRKRSGFGVEYDPSQLDPTVLAAVMALGMDQPDEQWVTPLSRVPGTPDQTGNLEAVEEYPHVVGYEITGRLGEGGMGVVWRAVQLCTRRPVALKLMSAAALGSANARRRFEREVELASRLEHPNIARVYDSGANRGICYYAMELIEGTHVDSFVAHYRPSVREILTLFGSVCGAVQHAHQRGVIHRDLKPSNILVTADARPYVVDFGLAKPSLDDGQLTITNDGHRAGTPAFMSPEQAAGDLKRVDTRSDVYSLGATLYLLLTHRPPHDLGGTRHEPRSGLVRQAVIRPRVANPLLDSELESILLKALSPDQASRYASAGELAEDLRRYLAGEPLLARPVTLGYYAVKWTRRHAVALLVTGCVVAGLMTSAVWSYLRVERARADAVASQKLEAQERAIAEQRRIAAESARRDALQSAARAAGAQRMAELRLARGLVAEGDAMAQSSRWVEAKERYREAGASFARLGQSQMRADLGLLNAYRYAPPPLLELAGHQGPVLQTAFSPDGRWGASAGTDGVVCIWDLIGGRSKFRLTGHEQTASCVAFSADGRLLISGSHDATVRLWDLSTGKCMRRLFCNSQPQGVAFSPRGTWCAVANTDDRSTVWEVATGRQVCRLSLENRTAFCVAFSPDERTCLLCGAHEHINLFDTATGKLLRVIYTAIPTTAAAFSADGRYVLTGHQGTGISDPSMILWDARSWQRLHEYHVHTDEVNHVSFSPDGLRVLAASADGTITTGNLDGSPATAIAYGDVHPIRGASISVDGGLALSGDEDGNVRLWDLAGDRGMRPLVGGGCALAVATSRDGRLAATVSHDGLRVWDVPTRHELYHIPSIERTMVAMSPDGRLALSGDILGGVHLLDVAGRTETSLPRTHWITWAAAFSRDGKWMTWADGSIAYVAEVATGRIEISVQPYMTMAESIDFSRSDCVLLSATSHGTAYLYILPWGVQVPTLAWFQSRRELSSNVVYRGNLRTMVAGSGKRLLVWDTFSGKLLAGLEGHRGIINRVALSSDDRWVASGSQDGLVKVWDLDELREARTLDGHGRLATYGLCWSEDGSVLLSGGGDGNVCVWEPGRPADYRRFASQVRQATDVLARDPDDTAALMTLGRWYAFRGHDGWAERLFAQLGHSPAGEVHLVRARVFWNCGQLHSALKEFDAALRECRQDQRFYLALCRKAVSLQSHVD